MSKKVRILSLVFALLLVFTTLSGCAGSKSAMSLPEDDPSKPYEIMWYFIGNGQQEDTAAVEAKINEYLKDKINATVKLQCYSYGEYPDKLKAIIGSGQQFDICFTSSWANHYKPNAAKGAYVKLNDYLDKYMPKTKEALGSTFLDGATVNGDLYAIPCNKEQAHQWGFIIKKDLADKYGFDLTTIKKLEDIEPMLKVIKENEPGVYPLEALDGESPIKLLDFDTIGDDKCPGVVYNNSKDLKVFNEFETPEMMQYFKTMRKFYLAGYIRQDAATVTNYDDDEKAGKIFAAVKSLKPGKDVEMSNQHGFQWVQVEITPPVISNRDTTGSMMAISVTSKNPIRAMKFLELVNSDKYLNNLINFGIENVHYVKKGENTIAAGPQVEKYNPGIGWVFGNQFLNYLYENEDPQKWAKFKEFNKKATGTQTLGFTFDPSKIKTEIAACTDVWQKYIPSLETGSVDPEEWLPKAIEEFKKAGLDKVIAEKQAQLNAWAKKAGKK
ncbi:MAG: ABC transporter substrate-binding protein [Bacillota bacterium]